jgi:hypothetical protein
MTRHEFSSPVCMLSVELFDDWTSRPAAIYSGTERIGLKSRTVVRVNVKLLCQAFSSKRHN